MASQQFLNSLHGHIIHLARAVGIQAQGKTINQIKTEHDNMATQYCDQHDMRLVQIIDDYLEQGGEIGDTITDNRPVD